MKPQRFHFLFAMHYLRYGFLLCLVPMVQALIQFDLPALFAALWQDAFILAACFAAAAVVWWFTRFTVEEHDVCTRQGVLVRSHHRYSAKSISVVEIRRPLHCRLLGAVWGFRGEEELRRAGADFLAADAAALLRVVLQMP